VKTRDSQFAGAELYAEDFAVWTARTAELLRARRFADVDIEHVAEEIEDRGKSEKRELQSRLTILIAYLLKWEKQPNKRTTSWRSTINTQRVELSRLFRQSPSLKSNLADTLKEIYPDSIEAAAVETGVLVADFPDACPHSTGQIIDRAFLPDPREPARKRRAVCDSLEV